MTLSADEQKKAAALAALEEVRDGMAVGLGTGSTAAHFVRALGERIAERGWSIKGVPTSRATEDLAKSCNVPLADFDAVPRLDLTVDGADEAARSRDGRIALIKGGGAALLREKIVAASSARLVIIADASKNVPVLGAFPLPIEIIPFGAASTLQRITRALQEIGYDDPPVSVRKTSEGTPVTTDQGNLVADAALGRIGSPDDVADALGAIPGVVDHGLFLDLTFLALFGQPSGSVERLQPGRPSAAPQLVR